MRTVSFYVWKDNENRNSQGLRIGLKPQLQEKDQVQKED